MAVVAIWTGGEGNNALTSATNWSSVNTSLYTTDIVAGASTLIFPAMAASTAKNVGGGDYSTGTAIVMRQMSVQQGCGIQFGAADNPLQFYRAGSAISIEWSGHGVGHLNLNSCGTIRVNNASPPTTSSEFGLNFSGMSNAGVAAPIATSIIDAKGGTVAFCGQYGQTGTFTKITVRSGNVICGTGIISSTLIIDGGIVWFKGIDVDTNKLDVVVNDGTLYWQPEGGGAASSLTVTGGTVFVISTNAWTTINGYGGVLDFSKDGTAKTWSTQVTALNLYGPMKGYDPGNRLTLASHIFKYTGGWFSFA